MQWCNHLVDLHEGVDYDLGAKFALWRIDSVDHEAIVGLRIPFGSPPRTVPTADAIAAARKRTHLVS